MEKIGTFEWIATYDEIRSYFTPPYLEGAPNSSLEILVIGCGTSTLAESLAKDLQPSRIIAVDNDPGCIKHMKERNSNEIKYEVYDLVELSNNNPEVSSLRLDDQFDLIMDKGTFDAIFVEGSVVTLLQEVSRLLKEGGKYFLFTINQETLLQRLFSLESLHLRIIRNEALLSDRSSRICILEKTAPIQCTDQELLNHQKAIADDIFQVEKSILTEEYLSSMKQQFEAAISSHDHLERKEVDLLTAYHIMFDSKPELDYSYELFLEDVQQFYSRSTFTFQDILDFLKQIE